MKERIIQFITRMELSSTKFADEIGVQRSSISHIISGRNKPSFDFIEKMLLKYPELNAEWLILGKGNMIKKENRIDEIEDKEPDLFTDSNASNNKLKKIDEENLQKNAKEDKSSTSIIDDEKFSESKKEVPYDVEKIVIFFNNGMFKEYIPSR